MRTGCRGAAACRHHNADHDAGNDQGQFKTRYIWSLVSAGATGRMQFMIHLCRWERNTYCDLRLSNYSIEEDKEASGKG